MRWSAQPRLIGGATAAVAGLLLAAGTGDPLVAALAAPFLVQVAVGLTAGGRPAARVSVHTAATRVLAGDVIRVRAQVATSPSGHRVRAELEAPPGTTLLAGPDGPELEVAAAEDLVAGGAATFEWWLRADRWGGLGRLVVRARVLDRFGMFRTEVHGRSEPMRALPSEEHLRRVLDPRALRTVPGGHASRQRGDGVEYADLRPFVPGDRARAVNWRASARRGELWVEDRHPDRAGDVVLFLDSFAASGVDRDDTLRRAVEAARTLAGRHLAANDRVGLVELGGIFRWVRPASGTVQLYRLAEALAETELWQSEADKTLDVVPVRALPRRALIVALSPLLDPRGVAAMEQMRARGLDVAVLEVSAAGTVEPIAGPRGELAVRLWEQERAVTRTRLRRQGVALTEWARDEPVAAAVDRLLAGREAVARWAR